MQSPYSLEIEKQMQEMFSRLSEKDKRLYAAIEALKFSYGGITSAILRNCLPVLATRFCEEL